jgi:predicted O-methyltransferase YrrM
MRSTRAQELAAAYGYLFQKEVSFLFEMVESLPDDPLVVNIGAGSGTSGVAILEARKDSFLVTVDLHDKVRPEGALGNERAQMKIGKFMQRRAEICSDSTIAGKNWWEHKEEPWWRRKVDMVFHDAAHDETTLTTEIEAWLPRVRAKGIIAVHDYASENWGGVVSVVDELLRSRFKFIGHAETLIAFRKEKL